MKILKRAAMATTAAMSIACSAHATVLVAENFDGENGGVTALGYTGFTTLNSNAGAVDLIANGDYGLGCAGGTGSCVNLDGLTAVHGPYDYYAGLLTTKQAFIVHTGDVVTVSFDGSGNQRSASGQSDDILRTTFAFFDPTTMAYDYGDLTGITFGGRYGYPGMTPFNLTDVVGWIIDPAPAPFDTGFGSYSITFTAGGDFAFVVGLTAMSGDRIGPLLDNFSITSTGAYEAVAAPAHPFPVTDPHGPAPEPEAWALMILGFGLIGSALRKARRRQSIAA